MCGIAGYAERHGRPVDADVVGRMTAVLAHRGPDGQAVVCRGSVGLGHRRLAIIDLSTGAQPMTNDDESLWITFNGEIYNFQELRRELESLGCTFRTTSDTEVILRAYEVWAERCVQRLRGMFAFAILDERRRELFLARDRVGIKPLVYCWDGRRFLFGSELKAILQAPGIPRDLDWDALRDYLTYHYVPAPRTIFRSVRKLPPACWLRFPVDGGEPRIERYWDLRFEPDASVSETEWTERLRHTLAEAVRIHMVSDVPIGAFLSGGVDSSTVVALMAKSSTAPVKTYSIGFDEEDFDELRYARQVAQRYGTEHYELVVKPDALDVLPELSWQFDEPFADSSSIPTYYVSKITREHVTVALSGDGGDEAFAGYGRYASADALGRRLDRVLPTLLRPAFRVGARLLPPDAPGQAFLGVLGAGALERYFRLVTYQRPETLARLLTSDARAAMSGSSHWQWLEQQASEATGDYVSMLQQIDIRSYLPEDILTKVDKASMLVSLESRVPLLDHVLLELTAKMPPSLKLRHGRGKYILKQAIRDLLPAALLDRRKMGFGVPLAQWFRNQLAAYVRDILLSERAAQRGLVNRDAVAGIIEQHQKGVRDHSAQIWALLSLEEWCRAWWDRSS
jgi:asparagine synthase (glutamine-hydrolysing)